MSEAADLWKRYCEYLVADRGLGFSLDVSRVRFDEAYLERMAPATSKVYLASISPSPSRSSSWRTFLPPSKTIVVSTLPLLLVSASRRTTTSRS